MIVSGLNEASEVLAYTCNWFTLGLVLNDCLTISGVAETVLFQTTFSFCVSRGPFDVQRRSLYPRMRIEAVGDVS